MSQKKPRTLSKRSQDVDEQNPRSTDIPELGEEVKNPDSPDSVNQIVIDQSLPNHPTHIESEESQPISIVSSKPVIGEGGLPDKPAFRGEPVLVAKELRKKYLLGKHRVDALDGVDFAVTEGEFVAIMGPSGSGKSTLLHLIGGLDKPSDGEVMLADRRLSVLKDKQVTLLRRRNVGFVFQFFNLLPTLTAEENIILPILIDGKNVKKYRDRLEALLELIGLKERRRHKPEQLSGGEQQRVAIARALITEPTIVLADEPTGNLDSKTGTLIMNLLRRSCDELGQTIVIVTHDMRAASYADRIVFLRDGEIVNDLKFDIEADPSLRLRMVIEEMEKIET